jgi:hypothetical protein
VEMALLRQLTADSRMPNAECRMNAKETNGLLY